MTSWKLTRQDGDSRTWFNDATGEEYALAGGTLADALAGAQSRGLLHEVQIIRELMAAGFR